MLRHKIKIGLFFIFASIVISFVFFTSIYINVFQNTFQKKIASKLDVNKVEYDYVEGNLIEGFFVNELKLYSKDFVLSSNKVELSINLIDVFNGFSDVEFIKFKDVDLLLKDSGEKGSDNQFVETDFLAELISFTGLPIRSISFINFNISDKQGNLLFNKLNIESNLEKKACKIEGEALGTAFNYNFSFNNFVAELNLLNKRFYFDNLKIDNGYNALNLKELDMFFQVEALKKNNIEIQAKGDVSVFGYNFIIDSFQISDNNEYELNIGAFNEDDISFNRIFLSGPLDFSGDFSLEGLKLLGQDFYVINGSVEYSNDSLYLKAPYIEQEKKEKSILAGELHFYDEFVDIKELKLKIDDSSLLQLAESSTCDIFERELKGDSLTVNYKNGKIFIDEFKFKNSEHYDFRLRFTDLNLDLFRGLKTKGKLSTGATGYLKIWDEDSDESPFFAEFYDAKIKKLSNKEIDLDELTIQGSFSDYELNITSMNVTKKIAIFSVSAGFSSLDDFYAKTIDNLKVKIK